MMSLSFGFVLLSKAFRVANILDTCVYTTKGIRQSYEILSAASYLVVWVLVLLSRCGLLQLLWYSYDQVIPNVV